jgi:hypothetical protein
MTAFLQSLNRRMNPCSYCTHCFSSMVSDQVLLLGTDFEQSLQEILTSTLEEHHVEEHCLLGCGAL